MLSFAVGLLRKVMRLGGSGRRRLQLQHTHSHDDGEDSDLEMGPYEQQMIAKYGPASVAPRVRPVRPDHDVSIIWHW